MPYSFALSFLFSTAEHVGGLTRLVTCELLSYLYTVFASVPTRLYATGNCHGQPLVGRLPFSVGQSFVSVTASMTAGHNEQY